MTYHGRIPELGENRLMFRLLLLVPGETVRLPRETLNRPSSKSGASCRPVCLAEVAKS